MLAAEKAKLAAQASAEHVGEQFEAPFELEKIPWKVPLVNPLNVGLNILVHHSGKSL